MTDRARVTALVLAAVLAACATSSSPVPEQEITVSEQPEPTTPITNPEPTTTVPAAPAGGDVWSGDGYAVTLPDGMVAEESSDIADGMHELVSYQLIREDVGPISMMSSVTDPSDTSLAPLVRYSALLDSLSAQSEVVELSRFGLDVEGASEKAEAGEYVTDGVERRLLMTVRLADERILSFMATCLEAQVDACRPMLTSILDSVEVSR